LTTSARLRVLKRPAALANHVYVANSQSFYWYMILPVKDFTGTVVTSGGLRAAVVVGALLRARGVLH